MNNSKNPTNRFTWLLILIEFGTSVIIIFVLAETIPFLKTSFYNPNSLILNIIFLASPIISWLLYKETDSGIFLFGAILLFVFLAFIDCIVLDYLLFSHESLGISQWLYIIPVSLINYFNYHIISQAKIYRHCPDCKTKLKLKEQNYCPNCGFNLYSYNRNESN